MLNVTFDYHTHTVYSHGKNTILENAYKAKEIGLKGIAITDHGFSHPAFGMRRKELESMRYECDMASRLTGIEVKLGIESNICSIDGTIDVKPKDYESLDVILAGIHRCIICKTPKDFYRLLVSNFMTSRMGFKPSKRQIRETTNAYINVIKNNPLDIISHVGFLSTIDAVEVAKCARDYGTLIEINTKKTHLTDEEWNNVANTGVNFVIDSDAHTVNRIGDTKLAEELIKRVDIPLDKIMNIDGRTPSLRFQAYKKERM